MTEGRALVPAKGGAVAKPTSGMLTPVDGKVSLPKPIASGILDLVAAFPAGAVPAADEKARLMRVYAKATDEYPEAVAVFALEWLQFHNPRNPFPPTPQDVYEMCAEVSRTWRHRVIKQFFGPDTYEKFEWGENGYQLARKSALKWGPPPLSPGCLIPDQLVFEILREQTANKYQQDKLAEMDADRFARFPVEAFAVGVRDKILAMRRKKAAELEEQRRRRQEVR